MNDDVSVFAFLVLLFLSNECVYRSEDEGEDIVDSDFSIDEDDEVKSDVEDTEEKVKRSKLVYKVSFVLESYYSLA